MSENTDSHPSATTQCFYPVLQPSVTTQWLGAAAPQASGGSPSDAGGHPGQSNLVVQQVGVGNASPVRDAEMTSTEPEGENTAEIAG